MAQQSADKGSADKGAADKGSLAARLALAAGVGGKGFKSIADMAKPAMKTGLAKKLMSQTPLDAAMANSFRAREDSKRAIAEGEINLTKMYARDHDGMVTARALLVGATKSLTRLIGAADQLEQEASKARAQMMSDQDALGASGARSITLLTAEREAFVKILNREIHTIETDATFSLQTLSQRLESTRGEKVHQYQTLTHNVNNLDENLRRTQEQHASYAENAEQTEARLSAEIARLCGVCDQLKADAEREATEHATMHASVVKTMSNALADKQRTIEARDRTIAELEQELEGTRSSMSNQLRDLAKEKELREKRLNEEAQSMAERNRRQSMDAQHKFDMLQREKEERERKLAESLENTRQDAEKAANALQTKIEKMRKLQELALGGVGGSGGSGGTSDGADPASAGGAKKPSPRGRQLLYWESLKSKSQEKSSMSWRGQDVFAHEMSGKSPVHQ